MSFQKIILATIALLATTNAHVLMKSPVPYSVDKLDNGPISKAQYPCKAQNGFTVSTMNPMAVGSKQTLQLSGSAVHGGGSCQLSISLDTTPTASSVFKVIKSMEGGCPGIDSQANSYDFELPASIPNGKATFAWTWFSKLSGQPELYMNCAPIEVTGGASDKSAFEALPDMLVANLDDSCESVPNFAVQFPNPGSAVQKGSANDAKPPVGAACGKSVGGNTPAQPSPSAGQPSSAPQSSSVAQPSVPVGGQPVASPKPTATAAPSNPGGVFAPGASSVAGAPAVTSTTLVTVTAAPSPAKPTPSAAPGSGTPAKPSTPSSGGGSGATSCSTNGAVVCNGEKQFGLCNNGNVVWQDVAAGTACVNGVISKRSFNSRVTRPRYRSPRAAMPIGY
ncbi:hypothetical protein CC86DRAFT_372487 [Ophiobolus disseminans]|uniref:Lytic polysaccharide monooxygenase n=1 Tax=Ophiobolus disseminans TaxID=1469910 RepID=A0A6A6ZR17_9PLEO|nr:hypothetical protein CC86DRAFT_372487 [Ophiobolus disseminans]